MEDESNESDMYIQGSGGAATDIERGGTGARNNDECADAANTMGLDEGQHGGKET